MNWIVLGEKSGYVQLVSKNSVDGMLAKGSFLTLEEEGSKFILRVEESAQSEMFSPSPLVVDMDLAPMKQDRVCKNILSASRIFTMSNRTDGLIDYIKPQMQARLSSQAEIDLALGMENRGPKVFLASLQYEKNQLIRDDSGTPLTVALPVDMFFHQMLICGKTGSGKTVAVKYLSQYFVEDFEGAVLAINVKDVDLLKMDRPTVSSDMSIRSEWDSIGQHPHGIENFTVYYPANTAMSRTRGVSEDICQKITLDVMTVDPESLTGLLQNISDVGAMNFPNLFRFWQEKEKGKNDPETFKFSKFVEYFRRGEDDKYTFRTLNSREEESEVKLHKGTFDNILRNLDVAIEFFDNDEAKTLDASDILQKSKMSVVDVAGKNGIQFGSVILRDLLHKIVQAKSEQTLNVPILIIIDEVHTFYNSNASTEALGDLDTICRTGRSQKIGVIFSSQNIQDLPPGISSVINTKIFFKTDMAQVKQTGVSVNHQEIENLKKGYAIVNVHELSQVKIIKFPLALAGVN